jgi:UDP-N-acetylglucosamine 2-epimerase (non-hydrolysing)
MAKIVGTSREAIVAEASRLLSDTSVYRAMATGQCPYGDGRAARRIATALSRWLEGKEPVLHDSEQFQGAGSEEQVAA